MGYDEGCPERHKSLFLFGLFLQAKDSALNKTDLVPASKTNQPSQSSS